MCVIAIQVLGYNILNASVPHKMIRGFVLKVVCVHTMYPCMTSLFPHCSEDLVQLGHRHGTVTSPYVRMEGVDTAVIARKMPHTDPLCQKFYFQAFFSPDLACPSKRDANDTICCTHDNLRFCVNMALENLHSSKVRIVLLARDQEEIMSLNLKGTFQMTGMKGDVIALVTVKKDAAPDAIKVQQLDLKDQSHQKLLAGTDICVVFESAMDKIPIVAKQLPKQAFMLTIADPKMDHSKINDEIQISGFSAVACLKCCLATMTLFCQGNRSPRGKTYVVDASEHVNFEWVQELKQNLVTAGPDDRVWVVSQEDPISGIVGMVNSL